jgi:anti-sigma factor RsiW
VNCELVERDLGPYIDRELDADTTASLRAHLRECAACRRRAGELETLGRLVRALPYEGAPGGLRARVTSAASRRRWSARLLPLAAAAVVVLAAGLALMRGGLEPARTTMLEDVVDGHVRSLMADHLFDVQSTDQHTVKPWFLGRLDFSPPVDDLAGAGFPLVGGRVDYLDGRAVAALVYERRRHTINLFVVPDRRDSRHAIDSRTVRGFHVVHWTRNGMEFWAVSDVNDAELYAFATALQAH